MNLAFSQIRIKRLAKIRVAINLWIEFLRFLGYFLYLKILSSKNLSILVYKSLGKAVLFVKYFSSRKLIWGRGRLLKPVISFSGTLFTLSVFFLSNFEYRLISKSLASGLYISSVGYIVPQKITATTILPSGRVRDAEIEYEILPGDTLSSIGNEFGVTVETIRYANNITNPNSLRVGQKLTIPPVSGVIHTVKSGDTIDTLATKYKVATQAIADFNYLNEPFLLAVGQKLIIPDAKIPAPVITSPSSPGNYYDSSAYGNIPYSKDGVEGGGSFIWPTRYRAITQYFSWYHPAIDIGIVSPLYASDSGTVIRSGWWANGYGFAVQIDHGNGFVTTYAHMSKLYVSVGDEVDQGQEIGMMGSTGRSTGPHVHFTIQYYGKFKNPLDYL